MQYIKSSLNIHQQYIHKERISHSKELSKIKYIPKNRKSFTIKISSYLEKEIQGDTRR